MKTAFFNRYGFQYNSQPNPLQAEYPEPKPLYSGQDDFDAVQEHGEWCKSKAMYPENIARIDAIMAEASA